jgi:signal transduction histidine kinase
MKVTKILVIDDEAILRNEMVDWLTFEDYEVVSAENGIAGVNQAIKHLPDLIVCDVTMPYLDGFGVLLEVHSNPSTSHIPFIFVTARAAHDDVRHGMNLGADDYITKPFTRLQLLEAIQSRLVKYTAREQLYQQELNQLQDALAQEHEQRLLKARMVAMFSHDFRNPLSTIMSSNNLLRDYADRMDAERRETHFNRIEISVRQLIQMLDDMLIVSQMESGHLNLKAERLDVGAFFQQVVEEFQASCGDSHTLIFENHVKTSSMADTRLLRQIISNLISNAIKYSPHGTAVHITFDLKDSSYLLTIQDQGIGISPDDQKRLFEAFERGKNVGDIKGTGLGLAIVNRALEIYGGTIHVESVINQGTTISVTIPVHPRFSENT